MRLLIGVLSLVRFHLLVLATGLILVLKVTQVRDMMLGYGLDFGADRIGWTVWLILVMEACGLVLWYTARIMLRFRFEQDAVENPQVCASDKDTWPRIKKHLPRWLGAGVFLVFLTGLATLWAEYSVEPLGLALGIVGALAVYIVFVRYRRRLFAGGVYEEERGCNNLTQFSELPRATRVTYWILLLANGAVMLVAIWSPHALAATLGPGAVLLAGAGLFVVTGSTLVYWSNWFRVPIVTIALLLVTVFSGLNENHLVRRCPGMNSHDFSGQCTTPVADVSAPLYRHGPAEALDAWVARTRGDGEILPVFVVATEGGGIRAAFWTAAVLAQIQDEAGTSRPFSDYVFAISGVSGGSLGGAVFSALAAADDGAQCGTTTRQRAGAILARDFLGPTLATMLFPDFLQRFWPHPVFEDRAMTIESAFERAWQACMKDDTFARPFVELWQNDHRAPLLFLNSTLVESGQRLVHSPVAVGESRVFLGAADGRQVFGNDLPLSTVVHNSARFAYVSPVGLARRMDVAATDKRRHWDRVADGGYFENSAALTAAELLAVIKDATPRIRREHGVLLSPYVIQIRNSEADASTGCRFDSTDTVELARNKDCARRRFLHESLSPLNTLLNVRPAHARLAALQLAQDSARIPFTELSLHDNGVVHPLGWMLSSRSRHDMTCQVVGYHHPQCQNRDTTRRQSVREEIGAIVSFLRSATTASNRAGEP